MKIKVNKYDYTKKIKFVLDYKKKIVLFLYFLNIYLFFIINSLKNKKKYIPIAYGVNNKYIYPIIVSFIFKLE